MVADKILFNSACMELGKIIYIIIGSAHTVALLRGSFTPGNSFRFSLGIRDATWRYTSLNQTV